MHEALRQMARLTRRVYERAYVAGWDACEGTMLPRLARDVMVEIGVPGDGYPANIAHAYNLCARIANKEAADGVLREAEGASDATEATGANSPG